MNYREVYPGSSTHSMTPPQVLISDHSGTVPLAISAMTSNFHAVSAVPLVPLPCTTPASVLPPSPPPVLTHSIPRVFVSDHSEVPRSTGKLSEQVFFGPNSFFAVKDTRRAEIISNPGPAPRRTTATEGQSESQTVPVTKPGSTSTSTHQPPPINDQYILDCQTPPNKTNHWLKRLVVGVICALVIGLSFKIGMELWKAAYGESNSSV